MTIPLSDSALSPGARSRIQVHRGPPARYSPALGCGDLGRRCDNRHASRSDSIGGRFPRSSPKAYPGLGNFSKAPRQQPKGARWPRVYLPATSSRGVCCGNSSKSLFPLLPCSGHRGGLYRWPVGQRERRHHLVAPTKGSSRRRPRGGTILPAIGQVNRRFGLVRVLASGLPVLPRSALRNRPVPRRGVTTWTEASFGEGLQSGPVPHTSEPRTSRSVLSRTRRWSQSRVFELAQLPWPRRAVPEADGRRSRHHPRCAWVLIRSFPPPHILNRTFNPGIPCCLDLLPAPPNGPIAI